MAYTYKYPRPAVTADCIVITREAEPKVLLIQRGDEPFKGGWAFPGGFMNMDETTEQCAIRELEEETGLRLSNVHQIGAYSKVDRDPRGRTITVAYLAIIDEPIAVTGQDDAVKAEWWPLSDLPHLVKIAHEHHCGRMEWTCLNWNQPSIDFYLSLGAVPMKDWTVYRLDAAALDRLNK